MPNYDRQSASYRAPSLKQDSSYAESYEYDGLDDMVRKRDEASALEAQKAAALYKGDIAGSLAANSRIRGLLGAIAAYQSGALPLSRVRSRSSSSGYDVTGPQAAMEVSREPAELPKIKRLDGVLGKPEQAAKNLA